MKKDKMILYLGRNILAVFIVTLSALVISIMQYYHCDVGEGLQRVFIYNPITSLYFLLLCSLNYCVFEFTKVLMETYKQLISLISICIILAVIFILFQIPIPTLFQYNFIFLFLLIILRICKQLYKKRSQK